MQSDSVVATFDKAALCERLGLSERSIENMVKAGTFPPPVRLGRRVYWSETAVRKWQQNLFAAQENWKMY
jgi:prophage regulatory protein